MANGAEVCCALGICCPPLSAGQKKALKKKLEDDGFDSAASERAAEWILNNFDLAPKGSLQSFKDTIADLVRKHPKE